MNLLLRTLQSPPPVGSLRELALILLLDRLEDIEHAKFRALAQVTLDKKKGVEAFEDYIKVAFPTLTARKEKKRQAARDQLMRWVKTGPLKVTPVNQAAPKSKLHSRLAAKQTTKEQRELYERTTSKWKAKQQM